ncbi:hypothetical protein IG631_06703 [Alternaria alternata]|nr:hypothetical protein IG631_06703 [Alternaria alternata]
MCDDVIALCWFPQHIPNLRAKCNEKEACCAKHNDVLDSLATTHRWCTKIIASRRVASRNTSLLLGDAHRANPYQYWLVH